MTDFENPVRPGDNEVRELPPAAQQQTLEDLIKAAGPLATAYFDSQERMRKRSLQVEEKAIESDGRHRRAILVVVTLLSTGIMILAGLLILRDKDQSAKDLIQLVVSLAGAGFGGYGLGRLQEQSSGGDE